MNSKQFRFALTEAQAVALINVVNGLERVWLPPARHPLVTAANALDEQMAQQSAQWERCEACGGSGWVEGDA